MAVENRVQLLWNCAQALKPESHTHKLLKSSYMNMCRKFAKNALQIPKEKFSSTQMCLHCGCFWSEGEFAMKLKPQQVAQSAKTKKLIEKLAKSKESGQRGLLSRKQRTRAKWLQKRVNNYIEIKCDQCKHKSLIKMEKPKTKQKEVEIIDPIDVEMAAEELVDEKKATTKSKKKKKNKDKSAGLKIPLAAKEHEKLPGQRITSETNTTLVKSQLIKLPANINKTNVAHKKPKNKQKSTLATTPSNTNKAVSKTQQQNSLLHLAALLKKQSTSGGAGDGKCSAQKRLESLLK